jgi:Tol biopolymer transport system component
MHDDWRADVARVIADGEAVDWRTVSATPDASADPAFLEELRVLEQVVRVHARAEPPSSFACLPAAWGPLTVVEHIGRGAFGDVYRAHDTRLDRPVALKLLRRHDPAEASAVIAEARLLARVNHPNVVTVYGAERIDGAVGVWMSLVDGPTLEDELRTGGPFAAAAVARIGCDLCEALAAVHGAGVLHQDVKAQNVMRASDGRVVLMDFGAGRETSEPLASAGVDLAGTPLYVAPEVLEGGPVSVRSDIYSLGVLLFHLLTGFFPVEGRSIEDVRRAHRDGRHSRLRARRADVPRRLGNAIERSLSGNPDDRFADVTAFRLALQRAGAGAWSARRRVTAAALGVMTVAASFALWPRQVADRPVMPGPAARLLTTLPATAEAFGRVSQDGRWLPYVDYSTGDLLVRDLTTGTDRRITDKGTWEHSAEYAEESALSRDGRWIAYAWFKPSLQRFVLRVASLAGRDTPAATTLLDDGNLSWAAPLDWSPDNSLIAVWRDVPPGGGNLALVSVRDGSSRVLERLEHSGPTSLCFSPDGRFVAFDEAAPDDQRIVLVAAVDGSRRTTVVGPAATNHVAGWSPDGGRLFVASDRGQTLGLWAFPIAKGMPDGSPVLLRPTIDVQSLGMSAAGALYSVTPGISSDVDVVRLDLASGALAGEPRRIEDTVGFNSAPAWSPDGRFLSYLSARSNAERPHVLAIRSSSTGKVSKLRPALDLFGTPAWAPDGRSIVVGGKDLAGRPGAFEIDPRTGAATVLIRKPKDRSFVFQPNWAPDGRHLYYRLTDGDPRGNAVAEWDRATGRERVLARRTEYLDAVRVSPDGRSVAIILETGSVMVLPVGGGAPREVFRLHRPATSREDSLAWTPDGKALLVSASGNDGQSKRRLWLVSLDAGDAHAIGEPIGLGIALDPLGGELAFTTRSEAPRELWVLEHFLR